MKTKLVFLLLFFPSVVLAEEPNKELHNKCIYPTVLLTSMGDGACSTGVVIMSQKHNDVYYNVGITVNHATQERAIKVKVPEYKNWSYMLASTEYNGVVYCAHSRKDLAIFMFISPKVIPTAKLAAAGTDLYMGQEIIKVGCGLGDPPRLDKGFISGVNRVTGHSIQDNIQLSIYTLPGDSGAAIFNKDYEIIGITQGIRVDTVDRKLPPYYAIGFAVDIKSLYRLIESEEGGLDFLLDGKELPILPWFEIKTNHNIRVIPENPWLNK